MDEGEAHGSDGAPKISRANPSPSLADRKKHVPLKSLTRGQSLEALKKELELDDHLLPLDDLLRRYETSLETGLSTEEVVKRQEQHGLNVLSPMKELPEWVKFFKNWFDPFSLLLWFGALAALLAFTIEWNTLFNPTYDNLALGLFLIVLVVMVSTFRYYQESKSSQIMALFARLIPKHTICIRDGIRKSIDSDDLTIGDLIEIRAGDLIPADIRIVAAKSFKVDNSSLTGESVPESRTPECTSENPAETKNLAFYSTSAVEGSATGIVIRIGDQTVVGRIATLASNLTMSETPLGKELGVFIRLIALFSFCNALLFAGISNAIGTPILQAMVFFVGVMLALVPEGLLITVAVCLTLAASRLKDRNCIVKNLEAVETLGSTSVICTDKTGTLTQNKMTVAHIWLGGEVVDIESHDAHDGDRTFMQMLDWFYLERTAVLCSRAVFKEESESQSGPRKSIFGDASEAALLRCTDATTGDAIRYRDNYPKICEIPFNSTNKYQLSIHQQPDSENFLMVMKGAPEIILQRCVTYMHHGAEQLVTDEWKRAYLAANRRFGEGGERVLSLCHLQLPLDQYPKNYHFDEEEVNFKIEGLCFDGLISLYDPPRPNVKEAVQKCRTAGVKVIMITGDHPVTAKAIAKDVGIISPGNETAEDVADRMGIDPKEVDVSLARAAVVHGWNLKSMSSEEIDLLLKEHNEIVFARTSPQQKLIIVESCQRLGAIVAVTGDGINDSPALKQSDIGVAMGIAGTDVSRQAADMILQDDNFATIVAGIEEGRLVFENLKKSIGYALSCNIPELFPFLFFIIFGIPLGLGTIPIIFICAGTDIMPAVVLAYEKAEFDIMMRPPRNKYTDKLVSGVLLVVSYAIIGIVQVAGGFFAYFVIYAENGWLPQTLHDIRKEWDSSNVSDLKDSYGQEWSYKRRKNLELTVATSFFVAIVVMQYSNLLICKTRRLSIFQQGMTNHRLNFALVFETALALFLVYTPGLNHIFNFYEILKPAWWFLAIPFTFLVLVYDEIRRYTMRYIGPGSWLEQETYY